VKVVLLYISADVDMVEKHALAKKCNVIVKV